MAKPATEIDGGIAGIPDSFASFSAPLFPMVRVVVVVADAVALS